MTLHLEPTSQLVLITGCAVLLIMGAMRLNTWFYVWRRNLPDPAMPSIADPRDHIRPECAAWDPVLWNRGRVAKLRRQLAEHEQYLTRAQAISFRGRVTGETRLLRR